MAQTWFSPVLDTGGNHLVEAGVRLVEGGREGMKVDPGALTKAWRVTGQGRFENVMSPSSLLCLVQGVAENKEMGDETGKIR